MKRTKPWRLHTPTGPTRAYASEYGAMVAAARLTNDLYDGRTHVSPWLRIDGPDGSMMVRAEGYGMTVAPVADDTTQEQAA